MYKLFNIVDDPGYQRDVLDRYPDIGAKLRAILEQWIDADALGRA